MGPRIGRKRSLCLCAHTVKGIDRSTGATATKRFDNVPAPSEIASWMQSEFRRFLGGIRPRLENGGLRP